MVRSVWRLIARFSLARQFMLTSLVILVAGMLIIGWWVGEQIKRGVINRTAAVTALYVDSFVAPHLQELTTGKGISSAHTDHLNSLLADSALGEKIVAFKIWSPDGEILYSTSRSLMGQRFPLHGGLRRALKGQVSSRITALDEPENYLESGHWSRLLETYAPVREEGTDRIIAVSEFYQALDELQGEIGAAQGRSWLIVGVATAVMYLLLSGMVKRGSDTIAAQQARLQQTIDELQALQAVTDSALASLGVSGLLETLLERLVEAIGVDEGGIWLLDEKGTLSPQALRGPAGSGNPSLEREAFAQRVLARGDTMRADDPVTDGIVHSRLGAPLRARGTVLGVACVAATGPRAYGPQEVRLLEILCERAALFIQNRLLADKVRRAAARTTALNEQLLHRISRDLHDGPAQDLGLALLRIDALFRQCADCLARNPQGNPVQHDFQVIKSALESAMAGTRSMAAGLRLPELNTLSLAETVGKAVRDYERKTGCQVDLEITYHGPDTGRLSQKITLYRVLQEALMNGYRHAGAADQAVRVLHENGTLRVEISDAGPGFDPTNWMARASEDGTQLGLAGMRERVEMLGGTFAVDSAPGEGTRVRVYLPIDGRGETEDG
ncbi:MAG: ATP-binding protein [Anaerolineae bacterium]